MKKKGFDADNGILLYFFAEKLFEFSNFCGSSMKKELIKFQFLLHQLLDSSTTKDSVKFGNDFGKIL